MNRLSQHRATGRNALVLALVLVGSLWVGPVQAALFEDTEARTAILEARKRIEANRIATDAAIQRLVESHNELLRRSTEENMQLRRSLLDLQNQIESLRTELARSNGQREQFGRELSELQREQKDMLQRQQEIARGVEERVSQLEPVKLTVDGREIVVEPAERRAYDAALALFRSGDFPGAQTGFHSLIARYPKSGYLPSALFWLGNAQYATRDYKEAIVNFRIMLTATPDHVRAPEALLSIANCQIELKDVAGARKTLDELARSYPQSDAAKAGKERLARLR
ncbi:MAG: tol-pal system protein YbgF [Rhodoferax sp.]|nr:tol-pal system protein YbgF [Rhodoferax sp.]MCP5260646.1 tol-pal system protein YbgF [Rhodoferax sp.]MCW5642507.1 tol-pal system protein YbgF [Rhodoferax sp.]